VVVSLEQATSVERIVDKIMEDARRRAEEIRGNAEKEAQEKIESARRRGEALKKRLVDEARKEAEQVKRRLIAESRIKARTVLLESKERLIEEAFKQARDELRRLSEDKGFPKILATMALETCVALGGGELEISVGRDWKDMLSRELGRIEREVEKSSGRKSKLRLREESIGAGVMVRSLERGVQIDSTFDRRLELLRNELRLKVAEVLFK